MKKDFLGAKYIEFFNKSRNAGIKDIRDAGGGELVVRYLVGRDIPIKNIKTWVQLFDVLDKFHPSIKK